MLIGKLADIDYLPSFFIGKPNEFHHRITDGFVIALIVAVGIGCYYKDRNSIKNFIIFFLLYCSPVVVDYFANDTSFTYGEQLFWPFSQDYYISSISFIRDVQKANNSRDCLPSLFSFYNFSTILSEIIIFTPIIFVVDLAKKFSKKINVWK